MDLRMDLDCLGFFIIVFFFSIIYLFYDVKLFLLEQLVDRLQHGIYSEVVNTKMRKPRRLKP